MCCQSEYSTSFFIELISFFHFSAQKWLFATTYHNKARCLCQMFCWMPLESDPSCHPSPVFHYLTPQVPNRLATVHSCICLSHSVSLFEDPEDDKANKKDDAQCLVTGSQVLETSPLPSQGLFLTSPWFIYLSRRIPQWYGHIIHHELG